MEIENDSKIAFLETDDYLTTSVFRKPTQTDQYLAYDSNHPQSLKRGIRKFLYDRATRSAIKPSVIAGGN